MLTSNKGSVRLFRVAGIDVFLHGSWFLVAGFEIVARGGSYSSLLWNVLEYLSLFAIVLMHEFGHALACRQVGGESSRIVLWPLGGVAFVAPPPRPGPTLWSIAAGPLVNVALALPLSALVLWGRAGGWAGIPPDLHALLRAVWFINTGLLVFNLLPIYPLDGGQILRSLLWFFLGRARSLLVTAGIGFVGVAGVFALALWAQSLWIGVLGAFILMNCLRGWRQARALSYLAKMPRNAGFACPSCGAAPPVGPFWNCPGCGNAFDTFQTKAVCPHCGARFPATTCLDCSAPHPFSQWTTGAAR